MSAPTPGPWVVSMGSRICLPSGELLASAWFPKQMPDAADRNVGESWVDAYRRQGTEREAIEQEMHANARLIAAAPELLEALIECLECEFAVTDKAAIAKALAAISKATGEQA